MKLTFKKAFGFDFMPADAGFWLLELGRGAFTFTVQGDIGCDWSRNVWTNTARTARHRPIHDVWESAVRPRDHDARCGT